MVWDGELEPGETWMVEIFCRAGPNLPVGECIRVEVTRTSAESKAAVTRTLETFNQRTDETISIQ